MPKYDPMVIAQLLRNKAGSAYSPAELMAMQGQQQPMSQAQMYQTAGAAMTPAEMMAMQKMAPMPQIDPRAQTVPMPQVAPQNSMGVAPVPMPSISREEAIRNAMLQMQGR